MRNNDGISVREELRQLRAWMQRRSDNYREQEKAHQKLDPKAGQLNTKILPLK